MSDPFRHPAVETLLRHAIEEDLGRGDVTSSSILSRGERGEAVVRAKEPIVVAGLGMVPLAFDIYRSPMEIEMECRDGDPLARGATLFTIRGEALPILELERTILNFLQRLSGIATLTRKFVEAVEGTGATVVDTRKTTPGWRLLEKYAVRTGGGGNHRFGLDDGILIKDNHIEAAGGCAEAVRRAREGAPHSLRVEIECENLQQVDEALEAGADAILLDNMSLEDLTRAVREVRNREARVLVEASGGITLQAVRSVAETGVDLVSVGALTHSARAVDLSMAFRRTSPSP